MNTLHLRRLLRLRLLLALIVTAGCQPHNRSSVPPLGPLPPPPLPFVEFNTEEYGGIQEVGFASVGNAPLPTHSIDIDTASYANVRRFLREGRLPPLGRGLR